MRGVNQISFALTIAEILEEFEYHKGDNSYKFKISKNNHGKCGGVKGSKTSHCMEKGDKPSTHKEDKKD